MIACFDIATNSRAIFINCTLHPYSSSHDPPHLMAEASESEIITRHPIGDKLNAFYDSFNSICTELSIYASSSALPQVVNQSENLRF